MSVHKMPSGGSRPFHTWSRKQRERLFRTRVWLNGRELPDCVYADARRGVVRVFVRAEGGRLYRFDEKGSPLTKELRGRVRVHA